MEALMESVTERLGRKVIKMALQNGMGNYEENKHPSQFWRPKGTQSRSELQSAEDLSKGRPTVKVMSSQPAFNADLAEKCYNDALGHFHLIPNKTSGINHEKEGVALLEKAVVMGSIEAKELALTFGYACEDTDGKIVWKEDNEFGM
jgi:hypothetical protein